jgi:3-methyladenine DNA glycosylase AlkD
MSRCPISRAKENRRRFQETSSFLRQQPWDNYQQLKAHNLHAREPSRRALEHELAAAADPKRAESSLWFFKTGKGEYGEGDRFLGITVPLQRKIARRYRALSFADIARLLASPIHEHRFAALIILVAQYERATESEREQIVHFYLDHTNRINNWDLVDASAPYIIGEHVRTRSRDLLERLAASSNLWDRRIAIVSTFALIKHGEIEDTLRIGEKLLQDKHDLIQKAVGWALREAGKVSRPSLLRFLQKHYAFVPRTTLRYAIEHFSPEQRKRMLAGNFSQNIGWEHA